MTATASQIRAGLGQNLAEIPGLNIPASFGSAVALPAAVILPGQPALTRQAMARGVMLYRFRVLVLASRGSDDEAQRKLDGYLSLSGDQSVWVALESDKTLGGTASDLSVVECANYGEVTYAGNSYIGAEFEVQVIA